MEDLDAEAFGRELAEQLTQRGLGQFSKRELDVILLHLLQKHSSLGRLSNGDASLVLRCSATRLRSLRLDVALRFSMDLQQEFGRRLGQLVTNSRLAADGHQVTVAVEDAFTRDVLLSELKKLGSHGNWTFNSEVVTVGRTDLIDVLIEQIPKAELDAAKAKLGVSSSAVAKRKLREVGAAILSKVKEEGTGAVVDVTSEKLKGAAAYLMPKIAEVALRLLFQV